MSASMSVLLPLLTAAASVSAQEDLKRHLVGDKGHPAKPYEGQIVVFFRLDLAQLIELVSEPINKPTRYLRTVVFVFVMLS